MHTIKKSRAGKRQFIRLRHNNETLTAFSGLCILQAWFDRWGLPEHLRTLYRGLAPQLPRMFLLLVVVRILGFRRLRELDSHRCDPMLPRILGIERLPDPSTVGRCFNDHFDWNAIARTRRANRRAVIADILRTPVKTLTLDFDGTVFRTRRRAGGTAVGFNPKRKGERSYYPLFCTVAQTAQVFDAHHRPGNVHDSNGAAAFMEDCISAVPGHMKVEVRADSAFFSEQIVSVLSGCSSFTISLPFMRFPELKATIDEAVEWERVDAQTDCFLMDWRPACWAHGEIRLVALRRRQPKRRKGPLQLDLFEPVDYEFDYSVVATNDTGCPKRIVRRHHGRGSQEGLLGELKSHLHADVAAFKTQEANAGSMWASVYAHNLLRRMQMQATDAVRSTQGWKRPALWIFKKPATLRRLVVRPGRLTRPNNRMEIVVGGTPEIVEEMRALMPAA